jgi:hypothetical protein
MNNFEEIVNFISKYPPVSDQDELSFDVLVSRSFIHDVNNVMQVDPDFLTFKREKNYAAEKLQHMIGSKITASLNLRYLRSRSFEIYADWDNFLSKTKNRIHSPDRFFIVSDSLSYPKDIDNTKIRHYLEITKFISILRENKDYQSGESRLVFLQKSNIEFEINYCVKDVDAGLDGISIFLEMFHGDEHIGQKKSLLKEALFNMLVSVNEKVRFSYLLKNFGAFSMQITQSYNLFVSEFSFDDIRREYEEKTREYVSEINKIFADVQTRMLGVPAILALAAFRFSTISEPNQFIPNFIILAAVIVYLWMMYYLIDSQEDTLKAIKREIRSQMKRFRRDYQKEGRLLNIFEDNLEDRCDTQRKRLRVFYGILGFLFLVTLTLFCFSIMVSNSGPDVEVSETNSASEIAQPISDKSPWFIFLKEDSY